MATAEIQRYWNRLVLYRCIITRGPAEIAHCHGGSIVERMGEPKAKGVKLDRCDWLVLPLSPQMHRLCANSLDNNVEQWEKSYGKQADWIDFLSALFDLPLWVLAKQGAK